MRRFLAVFFIFFFSFLTECYGIAVMKTKEGIKLINGVRIYYKIIGNGDPIVILHGGPGLGHNYLFPHFKRLAKNYRVIFYDQRSSGRSTGHENPSGITMANFVEDLEELRSTFALPKLNILGQSWGGLLALNYAIRYPEKLKTLILLESAGASSEYISQFHQNVENRLTVKAKEELQTIGFINRHGERIGNSFNKYLFLYFQAYFYDQNLANKLYIDYFDDEMARKGLLSSERFADYLQDYDLFEALNKISCPTLIIHGDFDPIPFHQIQRIHRNIAGSEFVLLQQCGHFAHIEKSKQCFDTIENFLNKHAKTGEP